MFNICFINGLMQHKDLILAICFAATVLGISTFISLYSSYLNNSRMADAYEYSCRLESKTPSDNYDQMADKWHSYSVKFAQATRVRAYSANLCIYSLVPWFFASIVLVFWERIPYLWFIIPLGIWLVLLSLAICIFFGGKDCKDYKLLSWARCPVKPTLSSWVSRT